MTDDFGKEVGDREHTTAPGPRRGFIQVEPKRPFVSPRITKVGSLPAVTTQFAGEFSA
jgi:hypothetical protein